MNILKMYSKPNIEIIKLMEPLMSGLDHLSLDDNGGDVDDEAANRGNFFEDETEDDIWDSFNKK